MLNAYTYCGQEPRKNGNDQILTGLHIRADPNLYTHPDSLKQQGFFIVKMFQLLK